MISNVLFDSEKEEPEQKRKGKEATTRTRKQAPSKGKKASNEPAKGKEATTHTRKQASSKGKEASNEPADKRKTDMMLGVSGRSFIDYIY